MNIGHTEERRATKENIDIKARRNWIQVKTNLWSWKVHLVHSNLTSCTMFDKDFVYIANMNC